MVATVRPNVARIRASTPPTNLGKEDSHSGREDWSGSGFLWAVPPKAASCGFPILVTNAHVVRPRDRQASYEVVFDANQRVTAELLISDCQLDLALLRLDADECRDQGIDTDKPLQTRPAPAETDYHTLHAFDYIELGEPVVAFGSPGTRQGVLRRLVSGGLVSGFSFDGLGASESVVTDVVIQSGMSGGPLIALDDGTVVGVTYATPLSLREAGHRESVVISERMGFHLHVPAHHLEGLYREWSLHPQIVYPLRGDLGVDEKNELHFKRALLPRQFSLDLGEQQTGAILNFAPESGSPAQKAGLQQSDIIVTFDGVPIEDPSHLVGALRSETIKTKCALIVLRGGQLVNLTVTPRKFGDHRSG